jgi:hypothetical protein
VFLLLYDSNLSVIKFRLNSNVLSGPGRRRIYYDRLVSVAARWRRRRRSFSTDLALAAATRNIFGFTTELIYVLPRQLGQARGRTVTRVREYSS